MYEREKNQSIVEVLRKWKKDKLVTCVFDVSSSSSMLSLSIEVCFFRILLQAEKRCDRETESEREGESEKEA